MPKPFTLSAQRILGVGRQALRVLDDGAQLGEPRLLGLRAPAQLLVSAAGDPELPPRSAQLGTQSPLFLTDEPIEDVELVRPPGEPTLLELARHRD